MGQKLKLGHKRTTIYREVVTLQHHHKPLPTPHPYIKKRKRQQPQASMRLFAEAYAANRKAPFE